MWKEHVYEEQITVEYIKQRKRGNPVIVNSTSFLKQKKGGKRNREL
jgi:hypothetical protein